MSAHTDLDPFGGVDPIHSIAQDVFAAMVDGGDVDMLRLWDGKPDLDDAVHAWVDVDGGAAGRVVLSTERPTAEHLTRALLQMEPGEPVAGGDMVDAFGEVANVVGGNVKALVPDPTVLSLPKVGTRPPDAVAGCRHLHELALGWRGRPLVISVWRTT